MGCVFFFNDTATTEIYPLSLHDALPIYHDTAGAGGAAPSPPRPLGGRRPRVEPAPGGPALGRRSRAARSEEHTSELQSRPHLVCRLLLEKKKSLLHGGVAQQSRSRATPS